MVAPIYPEHLARDGLLLHQTFPKHHPMLAPPIPAIIEANRKTELCRNHERGHCVYGSKCAYAHGSSELRRQTLDEMEQAGRIPNASRFRSYPCITWVSTGSCVYGHRCVFIHDPRLIASEEGIEAAERFRELVVTDIEHEKSMAACGGSQTSGGRHWALNGTGASPKSKPFFYWPDVHYHDNIAPTSNTIPYDLDLATTHFGERSNAVYRLWYSLIETVTDGRHPKTWFSIPKDDDLLAKEKSVFRALAQGKSATPSTPLTYNNHKVIKPSPSRHQEMSPTVHSRPQYRVQQAGGDSAYTTFKLDNPTHTHTNVHTQSFKHDNSTHAHANIHTHSWGGGNMKAVVRRSDTAEQQQGGFYGSAFRMNSGYGCHTVANIADKDSFGQEIIRHSPYC